MEMHFAGASTSLTLLGGLIVDAHMVIGNTWACEAGVIGNFAIIICGLRQYAIGPTNHKHRWSHQS
jgi:hypothetical protein